MRVEQTIVALIVVVAGAWAQQPQGAAPLPTPKAGAPIDLTGYWVSIVPGDRFHMITAPKGDFPGIPLNADGTKLANAWDPAKDEASGEQSKSYGVAAIMSVPGRFHITWDNDSTVKIQADAGTQTRALHFNATPPDTEAPSWQGYSVAVWERRRSLKVTTTNLRSGYLRKNGVPYSEKTTVTEYYDLVHERGGNVTLVIKRSSTIPYI
jgi:hypothetical protein